MTVQWNPMTKIPEGEASSSLRAHINAMCAHCMGCTREWKEPGFVNMIRDCTAPKCPLYHVRPYQVKRTTR